MASAKGESGYDPVKDLDLENDSDTTLSSDRFLNKSSPKSHHRKPRSTKLQTALTWSRWSFIVVLQSIMILLLLRSPATEKKWSEDQTETGGDINGLYVTGPQSHKYTYLKQQEELFVPNMTSNDNRLEIKRNWDKLMPLGSGSVEIKNYKQHPNLGGPVTSDPIRTGAIYEVSWPHALHCLYYTVDTYHQLMVNGSFGFDKPRDDFHAAHCFEYLRNQILCMADMTLEGSAALLAGATGPGQGHMCRNRDEAVRWIEERRVDDIQDIIGP